MNIFFISMVFSLTFLFMIPSTLTLSYLERLRLSSGSIEDFLSMVMLDGHPMQPSDVYPFESADNNSTGEKAYISGGAMLALPDECSPRLMTMQIPHDPFDRADYIYWPECTKVMRCGGCCPSDKLICIPYETELIERHVLRATAIEEGSLYLEWAGPLAVSLVQHVSCKVACRLNPLDCQPYQRFIPEECNCVCNERYQCNPSQEWDSDLCVCKCPDGAADRCSTNTVYDTTRCKCVISEEHQESNIAITDDLSQAEIDAYLQAHQAHQASETTTTPTTTTAAPTTTTTNRPAPTTERCANTHCPPNWITIPRGNRCLCRPRFG